MKALILVLFLAACGGGGIESPSQSYEVYSDSTGLGSDCNVTPCQRVAKPWPSFISAVNMSMGGLNVRELLSGTGHSDGIPFAAHMAASKASTIIIGLGINDAFSETLDEYRMGLIQAVGIVRDSGKRVIFVTPVSTLPAVEPYVKAMKAMAADYGVRVIDADAYVSGKYGAALASHISDGAHADQAVYQAMGEFIARSL